MKAQAARKNQKGAVSLFVVIFAMLIISVITISFLRLMMTDQRQTANNDLAQSAYDSAQAGVEDAKRALLRYQKVCNDSAASCATLSSQLSRNQCNYGVSVGGVAVPVSQTADQTGEVKVQRVEGVDDILDQAYTCVLMELETVNYIGNILPGQSQVVPLVGRNDFNTVTIRWFSREDVTNASGAVTLPTVSTSKPFIQQENWNINTPSLMRAQLIQFGDAFTMDSFDSVASGPGGTQSNSNTVFLYPTSAAGATRSSFVALDARKTSPTDEPDADTQSQTPHGLQCAQNFNSVEYICSMELALPQPIGGGDRTAFLRLTPFYNATHFEVVLSNGNPNVSTNIVRFKDVQPKIDATGRANDMFRRVESRVNLYNTDFPYPDATIDINNDFCKNFTVSTEENTYTESMARAGCTP